jgi:hypothetical protein
MKADASRTTMSTKRRKLRRGRPLKTDAAPDMRERILDAAEDHFSRHGFWSVTVRDDIRTARLMVKSLTDQGVPPSSVTLVVSRYHRRSMISISQAREALGRDSLVVLGSDFRHALESMTYGQPLAEVAPRSPLRKEIRDLALGLPEMPAVPV